MIAVDTNILVYSHRAEMPQHQVASARLTLMASSGVAWAIPWPCVYEFFSIVTNARIFKTPSSLQDAQLFFDGLIAQTPLVLLHETDKAWPLFLGLVKKGQVTSGKIHDAKIAAICLQHDVSELWSNDRDFTLFPSLKVVNPLVEV